MSLLKSTMNIAMSTVDSLPKLTLGKNGRIHTSKSLKLDNRLSHYVNNQTMGALDNYAKHEGIHVFITPLEDDMFGDLSVRVFKKGESKAAADFKLKIKEGKEGTVEFFRDLYNKVHKTLHPVSETQQSKPNKPSFLDIITEFINETKKSLHDFKTEQIRKFVVKHEKDNGIIGLLSDDLEEAHFNDLYK